LDIVLGIVLLAVIIAWGYLFFSFDYKRIYCMVYFSFYMPHGLEVDANDNIWITDVALHQVTADVSCDVDHLTLLW